MRYKLGEICEIVSGSTPKTGIPEYWDGDVKWITPAELNDNSYIMMLGPFDPSIILFRKHEEKITRVGYIKCNSRLKRIMV